MVEESNVALAVATLVLGEFPVLVDPHVPCRGDSKRGFGDRVPRDSKIGIDDGVPKDSKIEIGDRVRIPRNSTLLQI